MPNHDERRVSKMLWSTVSNAADRSRKHRYDNFCHPIALMRNHEYTGGLFQWNDVYSMAD